MSVLEKQVASALRDIAGQATPPQLNADAAWRAGRRQRFTAITASVAAAGCVVVTAVLLPLATLGGPAHPAPRLASPISLRSPIQFRQVAVIAHASCPAGSHGLPGTAPGLCFHLAGARMTVTGIESAKINVAEAGDYVISIRLTRADTGPFAALTRKLAGRPSPRNQLAIVAGGRVILHPAVQATITNGQVQITGLATRTQAEHLLHSLEAG
jgi:hypothetical protein